MNNAMSEAEKQYLNIFETASDGVVIIDLKTSKVLTANSAAANMHGYEREAFCGLALNNFIHTKNQSAFYDFSEVFHKGGVFEIVAQHIRLDESLLSVEWRAVAFKYEERNCALAILRDVSNRIQAERHLKRRMIERAHEQSTLLEISQILASTLELQPGLILDQLRVLIKYTHASLFTLEDSTLVAVEVRGIERLEKAVPFRIRLDGKHTLEALFNGHHPIRISDLTSDEPTAKFLHTLLEDESAVLLEGVQSWMWVPLAVKNRIIGGIGLAHSERSYFSLHDADLAMTIANQAAVTLANAELYEHAQTLAALQERQRLAQNLHDAVNQSLFSAGLIAEVLPRLWEIDLEETRHSLEDLRRLIRGAMAEMRALLAELRPTTLTDTELGELLLLLGNAFTGRTNIPVDVSVTGEGKLPAETQVALYRICQEGLNNIAKHAKASLVEIEMRHTPLGLVLNIRDNGSGFETTELITFGHYGLNMMKERVETVGAKLTISSQPNHGTEISIRWGEEEE
jgi:two-component system nitrate/nitrite sensor histidine kinase NarX